MSKHALKLFLVLGFFFAAALAFPATARASIPNTIRIGLTRDFANRYNINIGNTNINAGYNNGSGGFTSVSTLQSANGFTVRVTGGVVALYSGNQQVFAFSDTSRGAQVTCANGGTVRLGSYSYRGAIEFRPSGGRITAINVVAPEEYLLGVLPVEMSPSFHMESLKAQAIASRTFMVYRRSEGGHRHQGFDLCDTTHCQSYRGAGREHAHTTQAVNATRGLMLYYNNAVILAVYFASSGGSTDNSENVWFEARPYLRAVQDIAEHNPSEWERTFTWAQINTALSNANANIGTANGMTISRTSPYGRVQELIIQGTAGQWQLNGEAIRNFFVPIGGALMSRNFYIAGAGPVAATVSVTDGHRTVSGGLAEFILRSGTAPAQPVYVFDGITRRRLEAASTTTAPANGVTLVGVGWGHGVGMSQRGAVGMAMLGYTYREILLHYYTGVEIR